MRKERQRVAIKFYEQLQILPNLHGCLVFVQGKVINILFAADLNIPLCVPFSLVLLDSDINTYSSRRGSRMDFEGAEHGVVEVTSVLGRTGSSDSCGGVIPALILVFLGIAAEDASDGRNHNREVADGQCNAGIKGSNDSLPNTGDSDDQDGVSKGGKGGSQGTHEDRDQTETDGGGDADIPENPEGSND